jgi:hypothetical protein
MALAAADQLQMKKENNSELSVSNDHREWGSPRRSHGRRRVVNKKQN